VSSNDDRGRFVDQAMSLEVVIRRFPLAGRTAGLLIAGLAMMVAAVLASPLSHSDLGSQDGVDTAYPLMLLPALAVVTLAGLGAFVHPAVTQVAAVVSGITGAQVLGMAVVAACDWRNLAGVGYSSWHRGNVASLLAVGMFFAALMIVVISSAVYRSRQVHAGEPEVHRAYLVVGLAVAVALPLVLGMTLRHVSPATAGLTPTAVGQYALWWSAPWGAGIIAAGGAQKPATRRAALASVLVSVTLTCLCVQASPILGFGLRLPEG
jgi:hypothetical protein